MCTNSTIQKVLKLDSESESSDCEKSIVSNELNCKKESQFFVFYNKSEDFFRNKEEYVFIHSLKLEARKSR